MLSPKILFAIIIAVTVIGLALLAFQQWILGGIITVIGLVVLFFWWRIYQILRVSEALQKQDLERAERYLDAIKKPEKLNAYSQTYYYFFRGMLDMQKRDYKAARAGLKRSLALGSFRSVDEKATAMLALANLDLRGRNRQGAKQMLRDARELGPNQEIREQIKLVAKQAQIRL